MDIKVALSKVAGEVGIDDSAANLISEKLIADGYKLFGPNEVVAEHKQPEPEAKPATKATESKAAPATKA